MKRRYRLSKSKFTAGNQCHKLLWLKVHEPDAPELVPDARLRRTFETGHLVGERAQREFGDGVLIDFNGRNARAAIEATRAAIDSGATTIFEACFSEDDVFAAVDVLTKEADGWVVTEVKSTTSHKRQHTPDAAVQAHVVEKAGLNVSRVELMHLNKAHRHPDQGALFTRTDITDDVNEERATVPGEIRAQLKMLVGPEPDVAPGKHCTKPYDCPFYERCNDELPPHTVHDLNRVSKKQVAQWSAEGIERISQIPSDPPLKSSLHKRQRRAVKTGEIVVEPGLADALGQFEYPIAMFDFETAQSALPVWNGTAPYEQLPVQFSCHLMQSDGTVAHTAFLAAPGNDPRLALSEAMVECLRTAKTILAWNVSYERRCTDNLAKHANESGKPDLAKQLLDCRDRMQDLEPTVRNHVYHPAFRGSFSLKVVVPALLPELAYDDLEVADGETAAALLTDYLIKHDEINDPDTLRKNLLAYCERDTEVMVELFRLLIKLSERAKE